MTTSQMSQQDYLKIGSGACGTVWAQNLHGPAVKREDGKPSRSLANEHRMHLRILDAFDELLSTKDYYPHHPQVCIPQYSHFITPDDTIWWADHLPFFPPEHSPCIVTCSERIPPFPEAIRALLINKYCCLPPEACRKILSSPSNQACLIRPYIGRQSTFGTAMNVHSKFRGFSLQNFPLHADQMEELGIPADDIDRYAAMMGEALATLHWLVEIDGNDVEFVLAPPPATRDDEEEEEEEGKRKTITNILGTHTMWMLDFDLCRPLSMDLDGVEHAVDVFFKNDPYFPRPGHPAWVEFREEYLQTTMEVVDHLGLNAESVGERVSLATHFIDLIEQRGCSGTWKKRKGKK